MMELIKSQFVVLSYFAALGLGAYLVGLGTRMDKVEARMEILEARISGLKANSNTRLDNIERLLIEIRDYF